MGALANLLDVEGRLLRKSDALAIRGLALLERGAKYRAHRALSRAGTAMARGRARIERRAWDAAAVYGKIARGFLGLGHVDSAWAAAKDALAFDVRNPEALEVQGRIQLERGESKDALASFEKALRASPDASALWGLRGDAALAAGRKEDAAASYRKVASLTADDTDNLDKLLRLTPQDADTWVRKAEAHARRKEADEALHAYDRTLRIDPARVGAWAGKAGVH